MDFRQQIEDHCQQLEPEIFVFLEQLVNTNSFSQNATGLIKTAGMIQDQAGKHGLLLTKVHVDGDTSRPFHLVFDSGHRDNFIGLIGHFDTVHPHESSFQRLTREGDKLIGPGVQDMKSGLVCLLYAAIILTRIMDSPPPIKIIFNCDEEIGSMDSRPLIESELKNASAALILEGRLEKDNNIITARKGIAGAWVEVFGQAAHASLGHQEGASAVLEMAQKIVRLEELNEDQPGTSVSIGLVHGGTVMNVIPEYCRAEVDIRFTTAEAEASICRKIGEILGSNWVEGTRTEFKLLTGRPAMVASPASINLSRIYIELAAELGLKVGAQSAGGGSDANFTAAMGIPTLDGLGPVGGHPHTDHEYLIKDTLLDSLITLCIFIARLVASDTSPIYKQKDEAHKRN
jgi:glutamate carboxypeptidase